MPREPGATAPRRRRRRDPLPWAIATLGALFFARPLFLDWTFYFRDLHMVNLPGKEVLAHFWRQGILPLWNPYLHGGQPLLGDPIAAGFYPTSLLYVLLPPVRAFNVDLAGHVVFAALAAYALARGLRLARPAAWTVAMVYGFAGLTLSQVDVFGRLTGMPYLPLVLLAMHRRLAGGGRRWLALAALCGGLQLLGCAPEIAAFTWLTAGVWALAYPYPASVPRRLLELAAAVSLTLILGAAQILPMAELTRDSRRGQGITYEAFTTWSVSWRQLPGLLVSGYLGPVDRLADDAYWGSAVVDQGFPLQPSFYLGIPALALAAAAIGGRSRAPLPRRVRWALLGLAVGGLLLSLGRHLPGFALLYAVFPPSHAFRFPEKLLLLAVLPVALAAGCGVHELRRGAKTTVRGVAIAAASFAGIACAALGVAIASGAFDGRLPSELLHRNDPAIAAGLGGALLRAAAVATAFVLALAVVRGRRRAVGSWAIAATVTCDLLVAGREVNPVTPERWFLAEPPAVSMVRAATGAGRFYRGPWQPTALAAPPGVDAAWGYRRDRFVLEDYLAAAYRIPTIFHTDFLSLTPLRTARIGNSLPGVSWERKLPLLSAAAVETVLAPAGARAPGLEPIGEVADPGGPPLVLYRNRAAALRYRWIGVWRSVRSGDAALAALLGRGYDPRRHAVVEDPARGDQARPCPTTARVEVDEPTPSRATVTVASTCPGYLVIADSWAAGWRYRLDGKPTAPLRADYAFAAVRLSAGEHRVERRYRPLPLLLGTGMSSVTALALALVALTPGARRRRERSPSVSSPSPSGAGAARHP
jgi:hypothetical protein